MKWSTVVAVALMMPGLALGEAEQGVPPAPPAPQALPAPGALRAPRVARAARPRAAEQAPAARGVVSRQGNNWVEEVTGSAAAAPHIRIEADVGAIELRGAEQREVTYRVRRRVPASSEENARRIFAMQPVRAERHGDVLVLTIEPPRGRALPADYQVTVPRGTSLAELETRAGLISARDLDGSIRAETAGGTIDVDNIGGAVRVETIGGAITIGAVKGKVEAETAGGAIKLVSAGGDVRLVSQFGEIEVGRAGGSVRVETAGGGIRIGTAAGDVFAETAGGNITVGEAGKVTVATAAGNIRVDHARLLLRAESAAGSIHLGRCAGPVRAETAAGSIQAVIAASRGAWAESLLETAVGDISVLVPRDLAMTIRAAVQMAGGQHRISTDFPLTQRGGPGPGPREISAEGAINGGGAFLRLRTVSGNIEIRSQK
jgi:hypothetical protein